MSIICYLTYLVCVRTHLHVPVSDHAISVSLCESVCSEVSVVPYYNLSSAYTNVLRFFM